MCVCVILHHLSININHIGALTVFVPGRGACVIVCVPICKHFDAKLPDNSVCTQMRV